jgi:LacI family transcriptional regulator
VENRKRATLKDVAAMAGTSVATASRVLSGRGQVAESTRAAILSAAKKLNYMPDLRARSLRRRSSSSVGLIIPNLLNAYYTALADTISRLLGERGYHLLLSATRDDPDLEEDMMSDMIGQGVDGVLWVPASPARDLTRMLLRDNIPTVSLVRRLPGDPIDTVVFDDLVGSRSAVEYLIALGHRRIGLIGGDIKHSSNYNRWQGYLAAFEAALVPVDERLVKLDVTSGTGTILAVDSLFRLADPPTALFVAGNAAMPGVVRTLRQMELAVPGQVSLICFDDVDWFSFSVPPITAVNVSYERLVKVALNLLFAQMDGASSKDGEPALITVKHELIVRGSTIPFPSQLTIEPSPLTEDAGASTALAGAASL